MFKNPFEPYKNIHLNKSAVFFGSGPTILQADLTKISDDFLRFGVNDQIFLENINLDYWFMGDAMPQVPEKFYFKFHKYNTYKPKKQKFIRYCNWQHDRKTTVPGWGEVPRNGQMPFKIRYAKYYNSNLGGNPDNCLFKKDISEGDMTTVSSISFEVLQFILFCGVKKIYLIGHDCDYTNGTFAKIMIGKQQNADYYILRYWKIVKDWISNNYPDVEIYSINPVGLKIFPEKNLDCLL